LQYCGKYQATNNPGSFSITGANIGTPAADRMVHVLLMQVYTVALSPSMSSSTPTPTDFCLGCSRQRPPGSGRRT
jgi:hypothetical protein